MTPLLEAAERAVQRPIAPSTLKALALFDVVKGSLDRQECSGDDACRVLQVLWAKYNEQGLVDEREAVADVLDSFEDWSPAAARL